MRMFQPSSDKQKFCKSSRMKLEWKVWNLQKHKTVLTFQFRSTRFLCVCTRCVSVCCREEQSVCVYKSLFSPWILICVCLCVCRSRSISGASSGLSTSPLSSPRVSVRPTRALMGFPQCTSLAGLFPRSHQNSFTSSAAHTHASSAAVWRTGRVAYTSRREKVVLHSLSTNLIKGRNREFVRLSGL